MQILTQKERNPHRLYCENLEAGISSVIKTHLILYIAGNRAVSCRL